MRGFNHLRESTEVYSTCKPSHSAYYALGRAALLMSIRVRSLLGPLCCLVTLHLGKDTGHGRLSLACCRLKLRHNDWVLGVTHVEAIHSQAAKAQTTVVECELPSIHGVVHALNCNERRSLVKDAGITY